MLGAIIGDIIGSRFEFSNYRDKDFELFNGECNYTDDSIMTIAIGKAIMECNGNYNKLSQKTIECMQYLGKKYPYAGYGGMFSRWLRAENPQPYNSFGNGSAMRVSAVAYEAKTVEEVIKLSKIVTEITHNHSEGIKGAEATAIAIYLARIGTKKEDIKKYIEKNYYKLSFKIDEIRKTYRFNETCQETVPQALECFFESENFEDAIRIAISLGGDSDTIGAIVGSIAEAYYGIPTYIREKALTYLDKTLYDIVQDFEKYCSDKS